MILHSSARKTVGREEKMRTGFSKSFSLHFSSVFQANKQTMISVHLTEVKTRKSQKIRQLLVSNLVGWVVGFITGNNIKYSGVFQISMYATVFRLYNCTWIII